MWCKEKKYKEKLLWIVGNFKICTTFATANEKNGSLDEWLSQRSAKPCTAVRIRQEPPESLNALLAQLVEQYTVNVKVGSSSLSPDAMKRR